MNSNDFNSIVEARIEHLRNTLTAKRGEYAEDTDVFHNFARAAALQGLPKTQVAWNFLVKHLVSIQDMVADPHAHSDVRWDEKCGDAIAYLVLIYAMQDERE